jgi:ribosome-associated protein
MIEITPTIAIEEREVQLDFTRASGPGGQHVNKVATAVQLRFDIRHSRSLPAEVKERLIHLAGKRLTDSGVLIIEARRFRTQEQNRQDAMNRLVELIRRAARRPKSRRKTGPSRAARERRLAAKRRRSERKQLRRSVDGFDD